MFTALHVCTCQATRVVVGMLNPCFLAWVCRLQMVVLVLQASFAGKNKISGNAGVGAKQIMNTCLKYTLRNLRSDQIGCWSVGSCAQHKGGDGFLCGMHACDGLLHLFLTHDDVFLRPLFVATDFLVARKHASDVHLGTMA